MARPLKDSILYFSHDVNAPRSWKFTALRLHYGGGDKGRAMEQRFWELNCMIGESDGCRLDLRRTGVEEDIARKLELAIQALREFLAFLSNREACDLLNNDQGLIWTDRCQEELDSVRKSREHDRDRKSSRIPPGKPSIPPGIHPENHDIQPDSSRKTVLPDSYSFPGNGVEGGKLEGGEGIPENPAAASFPSLLKTKTAAAGIELAPDDFDAVASRLIAASCDCEEFLTWALKRCNGKEKKPVYFLTGVLKYQWPEQWKRERGASCSEAKAVPGKPQGNRFVLTPPPDEGTPEEQRAALVAAAQLRQKMNALRAEDYELLGLEKPAPRAPPPPAEPADTDLPGFPEVDA